MDAAAFLEQSLVQDAVLCNLQVLAESTQRLSDALKERHPEIEWYIPSRKFVTFGEG